MSDSGGTHHPAPRLLVVAVVIAAAVLAVMVIHGDAGRRSAAPSTPHGADPAVLTRNAPCPIPVNTRLATRAQLREFAPVAAVSCRFSQRTFPDGSTWSVLIRRISTTGIRALAAGFDRPDMRPFRGVCLSYAIAGTPVIFLDASGRQLIPRYPRDPCGQPFSILSREVQDHPWRTVSVTRERRVRPR